MRKLKYFIGSFMICVRYKISRNNVNSESLGEFIDAEIPV